MRALQIQAAYQAHLFIIFFNFLNSLGPLGDAHFYNGQFIFLNVYQNIQVEH
jgi:hypothetical protein